MAMAPRGEGEVVRLILSHLVAGSAAEESAENAQRRAASIAYD
jgi:hypothetical protein